MEIRIGIIGCGGIAEHKHMPGLKAAGAKLVAFYDLDPQRAYAAAEKYGDGAVVYQSAEKLLQNADIDAVQICTTNKTHATLSIMAMEAGKHVMCEKPMALNAKEGEAMLACAKRTNRKLTIAYQGRFRNEVQRLKSLCCEGALGDIYFARAHALRRRGVPTWGAYLDSSLQGGGCLIDIGTHALDLTLYLMDNYEPAYVAGTTYRNIVSRRTDANVWGDWDPACLQNEDSAFALIRMKNGATVELECSWAINVREAYESNTTLAGTKAGADMRGGLRLNGAANGSLYIQDIDTNNTNGTSFPVAYQDDPGLAEMKAWVDALRQDKPPVVLPEQALTVTRIIDAIYQSAREQKAVYFS